MQALLVLPLPRSTPQPPAEACRVQASIELAPCLSAQEPPPRSGTLPTYGREGLYTFETLRHQTSRCSMAMRMSSVAVRALYFSRRAEQMTVTVL